MNEPVDDAGFTTRTEQADGVVRVVVAGELDLATEGPLVAVIASAVRAPDAARVVVDVAGVDFIDSSGLRSLLRCREEAQRLGKAISLAPGEGAVLRLLESAGVAGWFTYD